MGKDFIRTDEKNDIKCIHSHSLIPIFSRLFVFFNNFFYLFIFMGFFCFLLVFLIFVSLFCITFKKINPVPYGESLLNNSCCLIPLYVFAYDKILFNTDFCQKKIFQGCCMIGKSDICVLALKYKETIQFTRDNALLSVQSEFMDIR